MKMGMAINGIPDETRKSCYDCYYCQGALSWWCVNQKAINERISNTPNHLNCSHWKPIETKDEIYQKASLPNKLLGLYKWGYVEVDLSKNVMQRNKTF